MQPESTSERHPVARLTETLGRVPKYLALARALVGDPSISRWRKAALAAGIAYLASPIDLVPGIIPVAGQLDDLAAALLGLRTALRGSTPEAAAAHLRAAGLDEGDIAADLAIVKGAAGWLARGAARATIRAGGFAARTAAKTAKVLGKGAVTRLRGAGRAAEAARKAGAARAARRRNEA
jgi:uncharacterized membrane protein YkvA (DUF1232 family)